MEKLFSVSSKTKSNKCNSTDIYKCLECELVQSRHNITSEDLIDIYSEDYYSGEDSFVGSSAIPNIIEVSYIPNLNAIEVFNITRNRLLDIGCGDGQFLNLAKRRGWEVNGVDISEAAGRIAAEQSDVNVDIGTIEEISFPASCFDVITMWDVIEHLVHRQSSKA